MGIAVAVLGVIVVALVVLMDRQGARHTEELTEARLEAAQERTGLLDRIQAPENVPFQMMNLEDLPMPRAINEQDEMDEFERQLNENLE